MSLLTTKEVQDLFKVDKSTIYRMAEDGRIPAVKVGRQWRFPSDKLEDLLGGTVSTSDLPSVAPSTGPEPSLETTLPPEMAQAIADLAGELFGVMAVVTDMNGKALTEVANPCGYFTALFDGPEAAQTCSDGWRRLGDEIDLEPRFIPSHLGFLCARSFVRHGSELVGMVIVGGIAADEWPPTEADVVAIAHASGVTPERIRRHIDEVYKIDTPRREWIERNLSRVSDLISLLLSSHARLADKLNRIAALAGADPHTYNKETP